MAPEKEIIMNPVERSLTDQEFLYGLDAKLRTILIDDALTSARINWHMLGNEDGLAAVSKQKKRELVLPPNDAMHLSRLANEEQSPLGRLAQKLQSQFIVEKNVVFFNTVFSQWRTIRKNLQHGNLMGHEILKKALTDESSPEVRRSLYHALHVQDANLADIFLSNWKNKLQQAGATEHQSINALLKQYDETIQNVDDVKHLTHVVLEIATPLILLQDGVWQSKAGTSNIDACDLNYWASKVKMRLPQEYKNPTDMLMEAIRVLGHKNLFEHITILAPSKPHDIARLIISNPGRDSTVIAHINGSINFNDLANLFHEVGHGMHNIGLNKNLLFVDAYIPSSWNEAMAFLYEDLLLEPGVATDYQGVSTIRSSVMCRRLESVRTVLLMLDTDCILRSDTNASFESLDQKVSTVYTKHFPLVKNVSPYWWANDMYVVEYPFYGINYLYGWMIAAQIRAWWKRTHTEPILSKAFGDFLRTRCYPPGNSIPWRDQLKSITGEEVNPSYLIEELSVVKELFTLNQLEEKAQS